MKKETRTIVYDDALHLEAYHLEGIVQAFPNHFHEYYVIGLMEGGERFLTCKNKEYTLEKGNLILFHPGDNHACAQKGEYPLDYRAFNIPQDTILNLMEEITGARNLPGFSANVIKDDEAAQYLHALHESVMSGSSEFDKEEYFILLLTTLIQNYGQPFLDCVPDCREEIEDTCTYMDQHYMDSIDLNQLCHIAHLSKSTLLRAFTKSKGVTPYRYLETIRINHAKKLLEQGFSPIDAALQTGFSDQSHFSNYFSRFIGLTPGVYRDIFLPKSKMGGETLDN